MHIANPIYDAVFKFMMNDNKVAKLFLSAIIDAEIVDLKFEPTESQIPLQESITVFRMDFKATVKYKTGEEKVIVIELQKAKLHTDIMRFRRYLGEQYRDKNNSIVTKITKAKSGKNIEYRKALPILSIYFLGHKLNHAKDIPVLKVTRNYIDVATGQHIVQREEFIESLTHDSFVIQIPYITGRRRTELEQLLHVFDQSQSEDFDGGSHLLNIQEKDLPKLYRPVLKRLILAITTKKVREQMIAEDELIEELQGYSRQIQDMKDTIQEKDKALEQKDDIIEQKDKALEEKDKALEEKDKALEETKNMTKVAVQRMIKLKRPYQEIMEIFNISEAEIIAIKNDIK